MDTQNIDFYGTKNKIIAILEKLDIKNYNKSRSPIWN